MVRSLIQSLAVLALTALGGGAYGAGLGDIHVRSFLGEPLDAQIGLTAVEGMDMKRLEIGLAAPQDFERAGIPQPLVLGRLRFRIEETGDGSTVIRVYSTQPIEEPDLQFLVKAQVDGHAVIKQYTVLLDPPGGYGQLFGADLTPVVAQLEAPTRERVTERAPAADPGRTYGPVRRGETLWQIAGKVRPDRSVSIQQTMVALLRSNPRAFEGQNINALRVGATLTIPSLEEISALSADEAIQEVRLQNDPSQVSAVLREARRREASGAQPVVAGVEPAQPQPVAEAQSPVQAAPPVTEPEVGTPATQDETDPASSPAAAAASPPSMEISDRGSEQAVGGPVAVEGSPDTPTASTEPDAEIDRLRQRLREKEAEAARLQAELQDAQTLLAATLPELGLVPLVTLPPVELPPAADAESHASPQPAPPAPSTGDDPGQETMADAGVDVPVPVTPTVPATDAKPRSQGAPVVQSDAPRAAPAVQPAPPEAVREGILRDLELLLTDLRADPVNLGLIGGGVLGLGVLGLAAVRRRRRPAREGAPVGPVREPARPVERDARQSGHAPRHPAERMPSAASRIAPGNPPTVPAATVRAPAPAERLPSAPRAEGAGAVGPVGGMAAGAVALGAAATAAARPRTDGTRQETDEDPLTAELSDLSDLDLGDAGTDMPEFVTGAGSEWGATDERDLDFDLELPAQGATGAGVAPDDAAAEASTSRGMAELADRLLDLQDAQGWDAPEPGAARMPDADDLQLAAVDLDAALALEAGERQEETGDSADGLGRFGDGDNLTLDEAGELDLLTETVIMDGLEFGSGTSSAPTASLSMADSGVATKLDLARAYLDMGDEDGARTMLDEVLQEGTETQRHEAEVLVARLGQVSNL